jgi:hypothetical protein
LIWKAARSDDQLSGTGASKPPVFAFVRLAVAGQAALEQEGGVDSGHLFLDGRPTCG